MHIKFRCPNENVFFESSANSFRVLLKYKQKLTNVCAKGTCMCARIDHETYVAKIYSRQSVNSRHRCCLLKPEVQTTADLTNLSEFMLIGFILEFSV